MRAFKIAMQIERTRHGRIRIYSDDLPGLVLSSFQTDKIMADVIPAIDALLAYKQRSAAGRAGGLASAESKKRALGRG